MTTSRADIDLNRVWWLGSLTVLAALAAVLIVRVVAFATMDLTAEFPPLTWSGLIIFTTVLVSVGVLVFVFVARSSPTPIRTYRRVALAALVLSLVPDAFLPGTGPGATWPAAMVLMVMHVAAWLPTVFILTNPALLARRS
jgi:peptidoglycan/LPS O-acetylase OafA/YrhL